MAKRPSLAGGMAQPKTDTAGSTLGRVDRLAEVMEQAGPPAANDKPKAKAQRSREGMAKMTIHAKPEARELLRRFAMRNEEGQEEFILKAINERLQRMEADFQIS
ncbi:MAG: hypothetical protein AAFV38_12545 [Pseudomonadota bacterium]